MTSRTDASTIVLTLNAVRKYHARVNQLILSLEPCNVGCRIVLGSQIALFPARVPRRSSHVPGVVMQPNGLAVGISTFVP